MASVAPEAPRPGTPRWRPFSQAQPRAACRAVWQTAHLHWSVMQQHALFRRTRRIAGENY